MRQFLHCRLIRVAIHHDEDFITFVHIAIHGAGEFGINLLRFHVIDNAITRQRINGNTRFGVVIKLNGMVSVHRDFVTRSVMRGDAGNNCHLATKLLLVITES